MPFLIRSLVLAIKYFKTYPRQDLLSNLGPFCWNMSFLVSSFGTGNQIDDLFKTGLSVKPETICLHMSVLIISLSLEIEILIPIQGRTFMSNLGAFYWNMSFLKGSLVLVFK